MRKLNFRSLLAILIAFALMTCLLGPVHGDQVADLQNELDQYKAKLSDIEQQLQASQNHQSELLNQIDAINAQMYDVEATFSFYQSKMDQVSGQITLTSSAVASKEAEFPVIERIPPGTAGSPRTAALHLVQAGSWSLPGNAPVVPGLPAIHRPDHHLRTNHEGRP
jgi:uncharacterized membrane-anchored protein YhcB (DUF1043 family)